MRTVFVVAALALASSTASCQSSQPTEQRHPRTRPAQNSPCLVRVRAIVKAHQLNEAAAVELLRRCKQCDAEVAAAPQDSAGARLRLAEFISRLR